MENRRVGVLGGSFDPPTYAHIKLGEVFLDALQLDEIRYVLARHNPLKSHLAVGTIKQRWDMLLMMIAGYEKMSASNIEITDNLVYDDHGKLVVDEEKVPSFAYNTLKAFQMFEPHTEFIFLGGSDILKGFYKWHKAEHLIKEFKIGIAVRPPHSATSTLAPLKVADRASVLVFARPPMPDVASTDVRSFFHDGLLDRAKALMQQDIFEYVMDNQIYVKRIMYLRPI